MSDKTIALIRQGVPLVWGYGVTLLLGWLPAAPSWLEDALNSTPVLNAVTVTVAFAWYLVWRLVERYVPPRILAIALGSSRSPTYEPQHAADGDAPATTDPGPNPGAR